MNELNLEDPQVRADVETVGRDFEEYGGDIPFAIVTTARLASATWEGDSNAAAEVMAVALSARDASKRMKPLAEACSRLHLAVENDQWLVPVLMAYGNPNKSPRDVDVLLRRAAEQLCSLEPNWPALARAMWSIHHDTQAATAATCH